MITAQTIGIDSPGGPEHLRSRQLTLEDPGAGEALIEQTAVGLNFIDTYHRSGLYPLPMPAILGMEGAGKVLSIGSGVDTIKAGDRVAYAGVVGGYATHRLINAERLIKLPDSIDDETAAASLLRGMTVEYLVRRTYAVQAGDAVLLHAAAGGVGLIAAQWLKRIGAITIGVVSNDEKAELAKAHGVHHVIVGRNANIAAEVKRITEGEGVKVAYDSVGQASFMASLDSLAPRGMMVSFGNASGPLKPFDASVLAARGSLFFTRPSLMHYVAKRAELEESASHFFAMLADGLKIEIGQRYPLSQAVLAHRELEAGKTKGASLLLPHQ